MAVDRQKRGSATVTDATPTPEVPIVEPIEPTATVEPVEQPKLEITPEIQALLDRTAAKAREEGRAAAQKKLGEDDSAAKLAAVTERFEKLEAHAHELERKTVLTEFGLSAEDLDEIAPGLTGEALRAKAEWLTKRLPAAPPAGDEGDPKPGYAGAKAAVERVKSAAAAQLSPEAARIAAFAAKMKG